MEISCKNLGKRYNREWIFKEINKDFVLGDHCAVSGGNGSGKSTFLKTISAFLTPTKGQISYTNKGLIISPDVVYKQLSYCAPYIDVFEQYTIKELFQFYTPLKPLKKGIDYNQFCEVIDLGNTKNKKLKDFSSGMRQRVKLALAILSDTTILLMDEPTSNLDVKGIQWYQNLIDNNKENRIILVASNKKDEESFFCNQELAITDYKKTHK